MSITVSPFAAELGADISGVDIREPLSTADRDAIRAAWLANLVLRFRDQPMTDEQHMAFTRQLGELEFNPAELIAKQHGVDTQTAGRKRDVPPEISVISNIIEDSKAIGGLGDGEASGTPTARLSMSRRRRASCARSKCRRRAPAERPRSSTVIPPTTRCPSKQRSGSTG
jgi:hypothetical protein